MPISRRLLFLFVLAVSLILLAYLANYYSSSRAFATEDVSPQRFSNIIENSNRVAVFFSSPTCTQCQLMRPMWQAISGRYDGMVKFEEVSYSLASSEIFGNYSIYNTPVFMVFINGQNISRHDGVFSSASALNEFVEDAINANVSGSDSSVIASVQSQSSLTSNLPSIGISFLLGVGVFASPCVLPLLPGYLGYLIGKGRTTKSNSALLSLSSFTSGLIGILAFGGVFLLLGTLFWSVILDGKLLISFALMALGIAALFNYTHIELPQRFLRHPHESGNLVRGVSTYAILYGVLALSCSLPFVVGAILNIVSGVDLFSMSVRLVSFAVGSASPLALLTFLSSRGISLSASKLGRDSVILEKISAIGMIAASVLLIVIF